MRKPAAQIARDYLKSRGIGTEIAKSWKLGYAPDSFEAFGGFAREHGFNSEEIIRGGLVKVREDEQPEIADPQATIGDPRFFDRFRNRVMFPICDDQGQVLAFSGRVLEADAKEAKYVNSPETMLFNKGSVLFGLHRSKRALIEKQSAIVCEGQLDLITAFEAGVQNVIATQGTAFTEKQARILKRFVEEIVLCFDADAAGEKGAERSLPHLLDAGVLVRVAQMPTGEDPDSMIRGRGAEAFLQQIAAAKDFFDFQIDRLAARPDFSSPRGRVAAARKMAESIGLITDAVLRETILNRVALRLEISAQEFVKLFKARPGTANKGNDLATAEPLTMDPLVENLIFVLLVDRTSADWLRKQEWRSVLAAESNCELLIKVLEASFASSDDPTFTAFRSTLSTAEEAALNRILEQGPVRGRPSVLPVDSESPGVVAFRSNKGPSGQQKPPVQINVLVNAQDCWRELEHRQVSRRLDTLQARMRLPGQSEEQLLAVTKEILDLQKRRSDIARPFSPPL
jgi:DNA primase